MTLADLFEKSDIVQNTIKATKIKSRPTTIVNADDLPPHIVVQFKNIDAGVPQRIQRNGGFYIAHSAFKGGC